MSKEGASGTTPVTGTAPWPGRIPQTPQSAAGMRIEPVVSVPSASGASPRETAEADPLDDPPGMRSGAPALSGVP